LNKPRDITKYTSTLHHDGHATSRLLSGLRVTFVESEEPEFDEWSPGSSAQFTLETAGIINGNDQVSAQFDALEIVLFDFPAVFSMAILWCWVLDSLYSIQQGYGIRA